MEKLEINIDELDRQAQYKFFYGFDKPYYSITTVINVDKLVRLCKSRKISFYASMSYVIMSSLISIPQFKLRIENGKLYQYDNLKCQFTALTKYGHADLTRRLEYTSNFHDFIENFVSLKLETEECRIPPHSRNYDDGVVFLSCLPWYRFSHLEPVMNFSNKDSIPRLTWGKYELLHDHYEMDLSITVHHSLIDGHHIAVLLDEIQNQISMLTNWNR